jgi:hypothetical protein
MYTPPRLQPTNNTTTRKCKQQGVDNSMFLTQWFVTLFTNCFPFEVRA